MKYYCGNTVMYGDIVHHYQEPDDITHLWQIVGEIDYNNVMARHLKSGQRINISYEDNILISRET